MNIIIDTNFIHQHKGVNYLVEIVIDCEVTHEIVNGGSGLYGETERCYDFKISDADVKVANVFIDYWLVEFIELIEPFTPIAINKFKQLEFDELIIEEYFNKL